MKKPFFVPKIHLPVEPPPGFAKFRMSIFLVGRIVKKHHGPFFLAARKNGMKPPVVFCFVMFISGGNTDTNIYSKSPFFATGVEVCKKP